MRERLFIWFTWSIVAAVLVSALPLETDTVRIVEHISSHDQTTDDKGADKEDKQGLPQLESGIFCQMSSSTGFLFFKPAFLPKPIIHLSTVQKAMVSLVQTECNLPLGFIQNILLFFAAPHAP